MQQGQSGAFAVDAENGLLLRRPGVDARLPGLRLLSDSAFAAARLAELGLKGPFQVQLVAHRLGKRAVLRIRHMGGVAFARLRSPTSPQARLAVQRHDALYDALASQNTICMPRPMGRDEDLGLALYDALPGRTPALRGLAVGDALFGAFETVVGGIADDVKERIVKTVGDQLVDGGVAAFDFHLDLLAGLAFQFAHHAAQTTEDIVNGHKA
jgi:hypothetical protein